MLGCWSSLPARATSTFRPVVCPRLAFGRNMSQPLVVFAVAQMRVIAARYVSADVVEVLA